MNALVTGDSPISTSKGKERVKVDGRAATNIPKRPPPAPKHGKYVIFMDHQKKEPSNSTAPKVALAKRGFGLGWVGVVARTGGQFPRRVCPSLTGMTGPYPGCLVSQPPRLLTTPDANEGGGGP